LSIRSQIELPELIASARQGACADVTIELGRVDEQLEGAVDVEPAMQAAPGAFQLSVAAGRYLVRDGRRILVDPAPGASERDVRLYLLGTVLAALCHQLRLLPLHATAVEVGGEAAAIAGASGAGKSTLAAQFQARGRPVLADDLCAVQIVAGREPTVWPGLRRIKVWPDSLALAGLAGAVLPRVADDIDKLVLPVAPAAVRPRRLSRIYVLEPRDFGDVEIIRLSGPEAVGAVFHNVHRWPLAVAMGRSTPEFDQLLSLVRQCPVFALRFRHDPSAPFEALDRLEQNWNF
jgi:hypothetical protein